MIIVAMRDPETVLLIREYVCGLHAYELGLPKGRRERGEDVLATAATTLACLDRTGRARALPEGLLTNPAGARHES